MMAVVNSGGRIEFALPARECRTKRYGLNLGVGEERRFATCGYYA